MRRHLVSRIAAVLVGLEGAGVLVLAVLETGALVAGDTKAVSSAIALLVLTVIGAAALLAFAVAIYRGRSWGRSGGIVTQLLILAVALGAATGAWASPTVALAIAVPAVVVFVLLVFAARAAGRVASDEEPAADAAE
ncbi:histidine kinase [Microbacterium sp. NPDC055357]